jgi:hypothetical protein
MQHNVPPRVEITQEEHVKLVTLSSAERTVLASFGGNRVWLDNVPSNAWVFPLLAEWRGLNK